MKEISKVKKKQIIEKLRLSDFSSREIEKIDDLLGFLSSEKFEKGKRISKSIENRKSTLFLRNFHNFFETIYTITSKPLLPFVVWVIYDGLFSIFSYLILRNYEGEKLFIGFIIWFFIVIIPLLILPKKYYCNELKIYYSNLVNYIK